MKKVQFSADEIARMDNREIDAAIELNMVPVSVLAQEQRAEFRERHPGGNIGKATDEMAAAAMRLLAVIQERKKDD